MKEVPNRKAKLMGSVSVSRATDGTKHKIINSNLSEIKKTERFLREKGVKDIDIAVTLPQKSKGSEMFPVNH